jgi:tetratricopeptide (TPR) repeat protein
MRLFVLAVLLLCAAAADAQTAGSQPGQIFDAGVSARALAMGSAFTAVSGEASSLYYNPAALGLLDGRRAEAMHAALYGGASFDYAGYGQNFPKDAGGWGVEVLRLGVGGIDGRDASDNSTGSFGYSELGAGAGFGLADVLVDGLSLGAGFKVDDRSLLGSSNRLFGADAGAQYGPLLGERLTVGLLLSNVVSAAQGGTSDRLPASGRLGLSYALLDPLLLAADVSNTGDFRAGAEYLCGRIFALRAGWTSGGPTFGGGVLLQNSLSFDVAVLDSAALGVSERLSIGYRFGAYRTAPRPSLALENLTKGKNALERREYAQAGEYFDAALADDPAVGRAVRIDGGGWKRKIERMRRLLDAWGIDPRTHDQDDLLAPTVEAQLAQDAIRSLFDGRLDDAMILAQVAGGEGPRGSVFSRLPRGMEKATGRAAVPGATLPVAAFVSDRMRRTGDAFYAHRFSEAVEYCRQNTLVQPDSAVAWERLGSAYVKAGRGDDAAAAYRKSLALDPANGTVRDYLQAHGGILP